MTNPMPKPGDVLSETAFLHWHISTAYPFLSNTRYDDNGPFIYIGEQQLAFVVPKGFNGIEKATAAIEQAKTEALEKFQATVRQLNAQLAELQALEN